MQAIPLDSPQPRWLALDWMRGFVIVLMTLDHASEVFNAGRLFTDAVFFYRPGMPLPWVQFLARWITHLCAPTFVFLAGTSLACSVEKRLKAGESRSSINRNIFVRGLLLAALDPVWMSPVFTPGGLLFQILYAIGVSFMCMIPLSRLSSRWLLGLSVGLMFFSEVLIGIISKMSANNPNLIWVFLLTGGQFPGLIVGYPLLPWLAVMMIGWVFGRYLLKQGSSASNVTRPLRLWGIASIVTFLLVRGANSYGNMLLFRETSSLVQWLHVSKYPPSLSFYSLELGIMAMLLSFAFASKQLTDHSPSRNLVLLGQTALFFYLLHAHLMDLAARLLGVSHQRGLGESFIASILTVAVLYPCCRLYRSYKTTHPRGWTRYI